MHSTHALRMRKRRECPSNMLLFDRFCLTYINQAMERLNAMPDDSDRELTVLEKLLIKDSDPRTAMVMALDMMGAGIDMVTN